MNPCFPGRGAGANKLVIPNEERDLPKADRLHFVASVIRASLARSFAPLRMTPASGQPMIPVSPSKTKDRATTAITYLFSEVFDLKPTSGLLWSINITAVATKSDSQSGD